MHNMVCGDHDVCSNNNNNNNILYIPLVCVIKEIIYRLNPGGHLHTQGPGHTLSLIHTHIHTRKHFDITCTLKSQCRVVRNKEENARAYYNDERVGQCESEVK